MFTLINAIFGLIIILISLIIGIIFNMTYTLHTLHTYIGSADSTKAFEIQNIIYNKYKHLIPKGKISFNEFCYPTEYTIQPQQIFAGEYMAPAEVPKEILIYHKIGAGKTCLAIQIAERWTSLGKPLVIMPASLIPGFRNELRSKCASDEYFDDNLREITKTLRPGSAEYRDIIDKSNSIIDTKYDILSYNKFLTDGRNINSPLLIIDEVQNINNAKGKVFNAVIAWIESHPKSSIVIMSGTPLFDSPNEVYGLVRLLRIKPREFDVITPDIVGKLFAGKISYFAGAPAKTFPVTTVTVKQCVMSKFQSQWYKSEVIIEAKKYNGSLSESKTLHANNDFYIKSRQRSNVTYPNGLVGTMGVSEMTHTHLTTHLSTYSIKMYYVIKKLNKGQLSFIYSNFTGYGGIKFIVKVLCANGYCDYFKEGPGKRRFAIWSGDVNSRNKDIIRAVYNSNDNNDASQLQIVIGSPSIKEGVTLLRTRQVHILEAYWNHSRLEQIFGRAVRYCSHKALHKSERTVDIIIYAAVTQKFTARQIHNIIPDHSIDLYMLNMADKKRLDCSHYMNAMINCAVDERLWQ